jgi:hypothetical protein
MIFISMKNVLVCIFIFVSLSSYTQDTTRIKNDSLKYEIVIIDPGFNTWLLGNARPIGFYSLEYLESYNRYSISEWNMRFITSRTKDPYQFYIDYDPIIKYGYEVNYMLFNYIQYFKTKTGNRLGIRSR